MAEQISKRVESVSSKEVKEVAQTMRLLGENSMVSRMIASAQVVTVAFWRLFDVTP